MKRVALYARISTADKGQDLETQLLPLREYIVNRGWILYKEYTDVMSWAKDNRPWFIELMQDSQKRKFDVVLVFRFDRCSRSSKHLINTLETLRALGIDFVSYQESIDTSTPAWQMMFTIISAFAQFERNIIQERVKAWLYRAKQQGKHIGRPKQELDYEGIQALKNEWLSIRQIAQQMNVSKSAVERCLKTPWNQWS
jgi:DNA invertase Pin-like site-specific DNA recombinase